MADRRGSASARAKSRYDEDEDELGYRVVNPDAPMAEPRVLEAINPQFQAKAEEILQRLRTKWLQQDQAR